MKWLFLLFLAAFFLCAGLLVFIRVAMDGNLLARLLIPQLEIALGKKISLQSVGLSWLSFGTAKVSVENLEVRDSSGGALLLVIPEAFCEIDVISAITGTPKVNRIEVANPETLLPALPIFRKEAEAPFVRKHRPPLIRPSVHSFVLHGGRVFSEAADLQSPSKKSIASNIEIVCKEASLYGVESFSAKAATPGKERDGSIRVEGHLTSMPVLGKDWRGDLRVRIEGFPVSPFRLPAAYLNIDFPFLEGELNTDVSVKGESKNFQARGELTFSNVTVAPGHPFFRDTLMDKGWIKFTADRKDENLRLDLLEVGLPGIKFGAEINIRKFQSRDPQVEISFRNADVDLKKFFPLLPFKIMQKDDRERLIEAGLNGHILVTGAKWIGKPVDIFNGKIGSGKLFMDAYLDKVSGFVPGVRLPVKNATGRVRLS